MPSFWCTIRQRRTTKKCQRWDSAEQERYGWEVKGFLSLARAAVALPRPFIALNLWRFRPLQIIVSWGLSLNLAWNLLITAYTVQRHLEHSSDCLSWMCRNNFMWIMWKNLCVFFIACWHLWEWSVYKRTTMKMGIELVCLAQFSAAFDVCSHNVLLSTDDWAVP